VAGGRLATEHLIALGHERIAFLGDRERTGDWFVSSALRRAGYEAALADAGLERDPALVRRGPHGRAEARLMTRDLLLTADPPTALFAASDVQALAALDAAEELGVSVPGELSVVGYDDIELARYAGLTTAAQPLEESGALGAELLLAALEGAEVHDVELDVVVVARSTTAERGKNPGSKDHIGPRAGRARHSRQDGMRVRS